ncbi:MAG: hypothetical protein E7311_04320 [Clostridiales bacterium]|nr:hypothetical protein [Clostridiales bacterium]
MQKYTKKDRNFYIWTLSNCIKSIYEEWGIDMMSMYDNIQKDFPNAAKAIRKMYSKFNINNYGKAKPLTFENSEYIYQAIANFIPAKQNLKFDLTTNELDKKYENLNMCSWDKFVHINRMDLLMAILLFTEEFIFDPISSSNVKVTDENLFISSEFVLINFVKAKTGEIIVYITVKDVLTLKYIILN